MTTVVWFRQDLRTSDNPALAAAAARGPVVPIFILDDSEASLRPGAASRWWLHHSLAALQGRLKELLLFRGASREILPAVIKSANATEVYWNRCYEPAAIARDRELMASLRELSIRGAKLQRQSTA